MRSDDLANLLGAQTEPPLRLRTGVVATTSPLTVRLGGSDDAVPATRLTSYTPTVTDVVVALHQGAVIVVLGKVA